MVRLNPSSFRVLNQDGASDMMHSVEGADHVGAFLREARENTGRSVADVAHALRIRRVYLESIEAGRFDELPGAAYAVGFVRSYATFLRLDAPALVERFKEEASGIESPQELDFPTPLPEGRFPGGIVVALSLIAGAAVFGGWYWYQSQNEIEVARIPPPPANTSGPDETEPATAAPVTDVPAPNIVTTPPATPVAPATVAVAEEATTGPAEQRDETAGVGAAESSEEPEILPVPPSYTQAQVDPLASIVDLPDIRREADGAATAEPAAPDAMADEGGPVAVAESVEQMAATEPVQAAPEAAVPETPRTEEVAEPPAPPDPVIRETTQVPGTVVAIAPAPPAPAVTPPAPEPPAVAVPAAPRVAISDSDNGRTYGTVNQDARIVLSALENTWVQVRDTEENVVLTQMLRPGDKYLVPNRSGLRLMTGNAGGLNISVDGQPVPPIGGRGESRRDVQLDTDLLKAGNAVVR